ncbi:hypothetical protein H6A03_08715 [[Clostridium] spiroforme]|nr:hypothetical protein [Thomasclavelia spiroformis]MBM6880747.1 hypothetical protein [Thomasclavelia spiroformis]
MNYCPRCHHVFSNEQCPCCFNRKIRSVKDDDWCFLIEKQLIWTDMIKQRLTENQIDYRCQGDKGAALAIKAGPYLENFEFYVTYRDLQQARDVLKEMFLEEEFV